MNNSIPVKCRNLQNHHFDSTIWDDFAFRDDDIIIASYAKSGTTWVQQIVSQLLFNGEENLNVSEMSPWIDIRVPPKEIKLAKVEKQQHRRFLKTHLPVDALVFSTEAKYIYVGRDGRDVVWSMYNHHVNAKEEWYKGLNESPGLVGPPIGKPGDSVKQYFLDWLENDGYPFWSFWENIKSWWEIRELPNVYLLHFAKLNQDMAGEIRKLGSFLEIPIEEKNFHNIVNHCSFDYMKDHASQIAPLGGILWEGGAKTFINKGINGRWKNILTELENYQYEQVAEEKLGADCARWLVSGQPA